jgi:hypothetical protein
MARVRRKITKRKRREFLSTLSEGSFIGRACEAIGVTRQAVWKLQRADPEFARQVEVARSVGASVLEDEAMRRGLQGVEKPIFQGGKLVGHVREYSDTLLLALLRAHLPEKYTERSKTELTGADGGPVKVQDMLPLEVQQRLAAILQRAKGRAAAGGYPPSGDGERLTTDSPTQNGGPSRGTDDGSNSVH